LTTRHEDYDEIIHLENNDDDIKRMEDSENSFTQSFNTSSQNFYDDE